MAGPAVGQDFLTFQGDDCAPVFTVTNNGVPVDLSGVQEITWQAARDAAGMANPAIQKTKSGGQITTPTPTNGQFVVAISAADSTPLSNFYLHRARIRDASGKTTTVTLGRMQVGLAPTSTYSGDPSLSSRDAVRSMIGDVGPSTWQFTDAEIDYQVSSYPSALYAAAQMARVLAGRYASKVNKRVGDLSINFSDIAKNYRSLADDLQAQAERTGNTIFVGGISKSAMAAADANTDRNKTPFAIKQFDIPGSADAAQIPGDECE